MPNPFSGIGNPYTRTEVIERLRETLSKGQSIIAAGAGISAKFIEKGGADLIIIYNSGRYRMMGHGSIAGMMGYGDANETDLEIGQHEVLPVVKEIPVICGVHCTDPRRMMWRWLQRVREEGFSGMNNFPTHSIIDGEFRKQLEETGMGVHKEVETVALARKMDMFSIVINTQYPTTPTSLTMPLVKHYGCFQFKAHITEDQIAHCFASMLSMVGRIPGLLDFNYGPYDSAEGMNDGYTHGFIMTFESPQARDEYLPHPIHEEVKAIVVPCLERVVVFDFNLPT